MLHEVNAAEHLMQARQFRDKTSHYKLTDDEIDMAKFEAGHDCVGVNNTIAYLYLNSEKSLLTEHLFRLDSKWIAPSLWKSEFRNVLTLYLRKKLLALDDVLLIIRQAESLMLDNEYEISSAHVMQLVHVSGCSAYDREFVALAKALAIPLITADKKIIKAFPDIARTFDDSLSKHQSII